MNKFSLLLIAIFLASLFLPANLATATTFSFTQETKNFFPVSQIPLNTNFYSINDSTWGKLKIVDSTGYLFNVTSLTIFNVTDPSQPAIISQLVNTSWSWFSDDFFASNQYVFRQISDQEIMVINVNNLYHPFQENNIFIRHWFGQDNLGMFISDNKIFRADYGLNDQYPELQSNKFTSNLSFYDISDIQSPKLLHSIELPPYLLKIVNLEGNYLFLVGGNDIVVVNLLTAEVVSFQMDNTITIQRFIVKGNISALLTDDSLMVIDLRDLFNIIDIHSRLLFDVTSLGSIARSIANISADHVSGLTIQDKVIYVYGNNTVLALDTQKYQFYDYNLNYLLIKPNYTIFTYDISGNYVHMVVSNTTANYYVVYNYLAPKPVVPTQQLAQSSHLSSINTTPGFSVEELFLCILFIGGLVPKLKKY